MAHVARSVLGWAVMRHHARLGLLLPMIAGLVACGGSVAAVDGTTSGGSSSGGSSSGGSSSSSGGTSSGGSSSGGSSSGSSGTIPYDVDLCNGGSTYDMLAGVTPAPGTLPVDYMEIRDEYASYPGSPTQPPQVVAKSGTACASAKDEPACLDALADARSSGWPVDSIGMEMPRTRYLVSTVGDNLELATSLDDLKTFIAPVENAKDAALLVTATGKYRVKCGTANARKTATGWEIKTETGHTCGKGTHLDEVVLEVTSSGEQYTKSTKVLEEGNPNCAIGRRPVGLQERAIDEAARRAQDALARFFGDAAYLEAASVFAFERLEAELRALGAPEDLLATARVSRDDEVRHARMTGSLAERFGAEVVEPALAETTKARTPFEIALENAVEGCVRETYGALVAHWQARNAGDRAIACIMHTIAEDETRHAALAWDVASWLEPQLSPFERRAVNEAREQAKRELRGELAKEVDADLVALAGMPRAADAIALLDALDESHLRAAA